MWKWILGALGAASLVAGVAHASRTRDDQDDGPSTRRAPLAPPSMNYWQMLALADEPGLDPEEAQSRQRARAVHLEALARILASEAGTASPAVMRTVAWIARNRSIVLHRPMLEMAAPDGRWGSISTVRPMASSQPTTDTTRTIAAAVLTAPQAEDPTAGATHGFNMALQDRLAEQGLVTNDAAAVTRMWEEHYRLQRVGQVETWVLYR
jgi:hypothetical protein